MAHAHWLVRLDWSRKLLGGRARRLVAPAFAAALCAPACALAAEITRVDSPLPDTIAFLYKGGIASGDVLNLQGQISALPENSRIVLILDSPGGALYEGITLGTFAYKAKLITLVGNGNLCASACSIAFLGGRDAQNGKAMRVKSSYGRLGFHQFSVKWDPNKKYTRKDLDDVVEAAQNVSYRLVEYFKEIDEDLTFLPFMLRAPSEQLRNLSNEEAIGAGIHVLNEQTKMLIDPSLIRRRVKAH